MKKTVSFSILSVLIGITGCVEDIDYPPYIPYEWECLFNDSYDKEQNVEFEIEFYLKDKNYVADKSDKISIFCFFDYEYNYKQSRLLENKTDYELIHFELYGNENKYLPAESNKEKNLYKVSIDHNRFNSEEGAFNIVIAKSYFDSCYSLRYIEEKHNFVKSSDGLKIIM